MHAGETGVFCEHGLIHDAAVSLGLGLTLPRDRVGEMVAEGEEANLRAQNLVNHRAVSRVRPCSTGQTGGPVVSVSSSGSR